MTSPRVFALIGLGFASFACGVSQPAAVQFESNAVNLQSCYQADAGCRTSGAVSTDDTICPGCYAVQIGSLPPDAATAASPGSVSLPFAVAPAPNRLLAYIAIIGNADAYATLSVDICGVSRDLSPIIGPFRLELSINANESAQIVATPHCMLTLSTENGSYEVSSVVARWD